MKAVKYIARETAGTFLLIPLIVLGGICMGLIWLCDRIGYDIDERF